MEDEKKILVIGENIPTNSALSKHNSIVKGKINAELFKESFLKDAELAMKKLEEHNEIESKRKNNQVFYIQGFAVIGISRLKASKKLRSIMGRIILNPDVEFEQLKDTMIAIRNNAMPNQPEDSANSVGISK